MGSLISVKGLTKSFGGLVAVVDLDFEIPKNSILGLVGPNGSGKTTTFNLISGVIRPDAGEILFKGENIAGLKPYQICRKGIARTFQIPQPFKNMTVLESVMLGFLYGHSRKMNIREARFKALETVHMLGLDAKKDFLCDNLTLVDQRRTEIARAMATSPELLLLDEAIAGLNPTETQELIDVVREIKARGLTIIFIEHVMRAVMAVCDKVLVLDYGRKIGWDTPSNIATDENVIKAYLGSRGRKHAQG
jgi:branched-chain amino acid transport system ATP-binding protein